MIIYFIFHQKFLHLKYFYISGKASKCIPILKYFPVLCCGSLTIKDNILFRTFHFLLDFIFTE